MEQTEPNTRMSTLKQVNRKNAHWRECATQSADDAPSLLHQQIKRNETNDERVGRKQYKAQSSQ